MSPSCNPKNSTHNKSTGVLRVCAVPWLMQAFLPWVMFILGWGFLNQNIIWCSMAISLSPWSYSQWMLLMAASTIRSVCQDLCRECVAPEKALGTSIFELIQQDELCMRRYLQVSIVSGRRCQKWDDLPGLSPLRWIFNPSQAFVVHATPIVKLDTCSGCWFLALTIDTFLSCSQ